MLTSKVIIIFLAIFLATFIVYVIQFYRLYQGAKPIARQIIYAVLLSALINAAGLAFALTALVADQQKIAVIPWVPFIFVVGVFWLASSLAVKHQKNMALKHG